MRDTAPRGSPYERSASQSALHWMLPANWISGLEFGSAFTEAH